ncbi:AaceriAGL297Cp [[Ashbya] aceris (nom. inval.)]|nr:AaceriAGL297Cp [[Ashbya] aceris (nom. inval.)]
MGMSGAPTAVLNGGSSIPIIEIATYAGVDVYECYCRGKESSIVMRRLHDDWVNITQVFKVATFSKTQRTKILEKESADISHEKIQGGYGRFQGTWIPLDSAKGLVAKYEITDIVVLTVINFQPDPMNMPPRRSKNSIIKKLSPATRITSPSSYNKTPKKKVSDMASQSTTGSVSKKAKKRAGAKAAQPSPLQNLVFQTPQQQHRGSQQQTNYTIVGHEQETPISSIMVIETTSSMQKRTHRRSASSVMLLPPAPSNKKADSSLPVAPVTSSTSKQHRYATTQKPLQFYPFPVPSSSSNTMQDIHIISENPNQKHKTKKPASKSKSRTGAQATQTPAQTKKTPAGKNNPKMSSFTILPPITAIHKTSTSSGSNTSHGSSLDCYSSNDNPTPISSRSGSPESKETFTPSEYKNLILQVLSTEYDSCEPVLPEKLYYPPIGLDVNFIIDKQGHTSLHWAAAMANIPLIKILLTLEADVFHCNDKGFNCITKSIFYNNCYRTGAFFLIVELLRTCLVTPDANGRLPLHYLVELSVNKSKDPLVTNYYIDTILDVLSKDDPSVLKMCLNYQDSIGNTVLHLAALNMNLALSNKLYYMGSSMEIVNSHQQTPASILSKANMAQPMPNVMNTPMPAMMPTPVTAPISANTGQESFRKKQSKLSTPLRPRKNNKDDQISATRQKIQLCETTFTETPQNPNVVASATRSTSMPAPSSALSKTPSHHEKLFALDRIAELNSTPVLKVTTPGGTAMKELSAPTASQETISEHRYSVSVDPLMQIPKSTRLTFPNVANTAQEFSELSQSLTEAIEQNFIKVGTEIAKATEGIEGIDRSLKFSEKQVADILVKHGVPDTEQLKHKLQEEQDALQAQISRFANSIEKSQALTLATLVHDEEEKADADTDSTHEPPADGAKQLFRLGLELSLLQLKRKHIIDKVCRAKTTINSGTKIYKYRKLIGISSDDIESKLNDIENDLRGAVA